MFQATFLVAIQRWFQRKPDDELSEHIKPSLDSAIQLWEALYTATPVTFESLVTAFETETISFYINHYKNNVLLLGKLEETFKQLKEKQKKPRSPKASFKTIYTACRSEILTAYVVQSIFNQITQKLYNVETPKAGILATPIVNTNENSLPKLLITSKHLAHQTFSDYLLKDAPDFESGHGDISDYINNVLNHAASKLSGKNLKGLIGSVLLSMLFGEASDNNPLNMLYDEGNDVILRIDATPFKLAREKNNPNNKTEYGYESILADFNQRKANSALKKLFSRQVFSDQYLKDFSCLQAMRICASDNKLLNMTVEVEKELTSVIYQGISMIIINTISNPEQECLQHLHALSTLSNNDNISNLVEGVFEDLSDVFLENESVMHAARETLNASLQHPFTNRTVNRFLAREKAILSQSQDNLFSGRSLHRENAAASSQSSAPST